MASDAVMQAIGRIERALARAEGIAQQLDEARARAREAQQAEADQNAIDIDPFSREKAVAALKSLDALIGDLQKTRGEA